MKKSRRMIRMASLALLSGFGTLSLFPSTDLTSTRQRLEEQRRFQMAQYRELSRAYTTPSTHSSKV